MTITLQEKYQQERAKRLNSKGLGQYLDAAKSAQYTLGKDPWVPEGTPMQRPVTEGGHVKIAIFGAGIGGICAAARSLIEGSASSPEDLLIVDPAGGFGGTWYHNRYPGLMCDVESYVYLPLLEETGYMPKRKYAAGEEIRQYLEAVATKYGLQSRAMFQTQGTAATWDSEATLWECEVLGNPKGRDKFSLKFTADYVIICSGGFTAPKIPDVPGMETFKGDMIHTGRWRYDITGGSPDNPVLDKLKGKRVALVGTGATAVQAVPATAKYAKELYVFQRTASAVDYRGNGDTDVDEWKSKIAVKEGWQHERGENFQSHTEGGDDTPEEDLVNDGMSQMPTLSGAWGGSKEVKQEDIAKYLEEMNELDGTRSDRVRQRVMDVVKDQETAKALQAWYPGWCKRPTFHDDYLEAFNQPNVHLVDTAGKGVAALIPGGISQNGKEYPVDLIIWSTGYGSPLSESLAGKAGITVTGKNGLDMEAQFKNAQLMTLHGLIGHNFPNLFYTGFSQSGVGVNQTQRIDEQCLHIAYTIREAERRRGDTQQKVMIEPTQAACDQWGDMCAGYAHKLATMSGCTPSYFNGEGESDRLTSEQQKGAARCAIWGQGYLDYARRLQEWRAKGGLEGFEVEVV